MSNATQIAEYEVFRNDKNALAFFFHRQPTLDKNPAAGPFWFTVRDNAILAGTGANHVLFPEVKQDIIGIAQKRGVLMLMEFEGQTPVRCTPCYLTDNF